MLQKVQYFAVNNDTILSVHAVQDNKCFSRASDVSQINNVQKQVRYYGPPAFLQCVYITEIYLYDIHSCTHSEKDVAAVFSNTGQTNINCII